MRSRSTVPQTRESDELSRLSPMTKTWSGGTTLRAKSRGPRPGSWIVSCLRVAQGLHPELAVVVLEQPGRARRLVVADRAAARARAGRLAVDVELLLLHLDDVARQADDALDVVDALVVRELEDDDVAPLGLGELEDLRVR